jgi:hypothetical protein
VGNLPAVSSASRCALSLDSWVAFSFGLNVPLGAPLGGLDGVGAAEVLPCVVVVAAPLEAAPKTVAPTAPPPSTDPAIAAVMMPLRIGLMVSSFAIRIPSLTEAVHHRARDCSTHPARGLGVPRQSHRDVGREEDLAAPVMLWGDGGRRLIARRVRLGVGAPADT